GAVQLLDDLGAGGPSSTHGRSSLTGCLRGLAAIVPRLTDAGKENQTPVFAADRLSWGEGGRGRKHAWGPAGPGMGPRAPRWSGGEGGASVAARASAASFASGSWSWAAARRARATGRRGFLPLALLAGGGAGGGKPTARWVRRTSPCWRASSRWSRCSSLCRRA